MSRLQKTGKAKEVSSAVKRKLTALVVGSFGVSLALAVTDGKPEQEIVLSVLFVATVGLIVYHIVKTRRIATSSRVTADAKKIVEGKVVK